MMTSYLIAAVGLLLATVCAYETSNEKERNGDWAMENPNLFEGDIIGEEEDVKDGRMKRNAVVEKYRRWKNGTIPYVINENLEPYKIRIQAAMADYKRLTDDCVRFVERTDETQYLDIFKGQGCYSHVGKALGGQRLSLGRGCHSFGSIAHELGHAIGFYHEHSRSDRDDYITVHWDNIKPGMEVEFKKLRPRENQLFDEFDYNSIMLYGESYFSKEYGLKTMEAKDENIKLLDVKDKFEPSNSDIYRIRKLYECE